MRKCLHVALSVALIAIASPISPVSAQAVDEKCGRENPDDGSSICAQWVAARAAKDSADSAQETLLVSIVGLGGIFLTLLFTASTTWSQYVLARNENNRARLEKKLSRPEIGVKIENCFIDLAETKHYFSVWADFTPSAGPIRHLHVEARYSLEIGNWRWEKVERVKADFNLQQTEGGHIKFFQDLSVDPAQIRDPEFSKTGIRLRFIATYRDLSGDVYKDILEYEGLWAGEQARGNSNGVETLFIKPVLAVLPKPVQPPPPLRWWQWRRPQGT